MLDIYDEVMQKGGIKINNVGNVEGFDDEYTRFRVTSNVSKLTDSNAILVCTSYLAHKDVGNMIKSIKDNEKTPIIAFPGKLGSSYLLQNAGEISSSPFGVTKESISSNSNSVTLNVINRKLGLKYAHLNSDRNEEDIIFLNELFGKNSFVDGEHPFKVGLENHDYSINVASMCDNKSFLISDSPNDTKLPIYALSREYTQLLKDVFCERQAVARIFGWDIASLEEWMNNREKRPEGSDLYEKLKNAYSEQLISIGGQDRRIVEDPWALALFENIAKELGIESKATSDLVQEASNIREILGYNGFGYNLYDLNVGMNEFPEIKNPIVAKL